MTRTEKILIVFPCILGAASVPFLTYTDLSFGLIGLAFLFGIMPLILYYIFKVAGILYKLILSFLFIEPITILWVIHHYPGTQAMAFLSATGGLLFAGLLFYNGFTKKGLWSPHPFYLCGLAIGARALSSFQGVFREDAVSIGLLTPSSMEAPLVILLFVAALLLKFKEKDLGLGIDKVLNLFLLRSGLLIVLNLGFLGSHLFQ